MTLTDRTVHALLAAFRSSDPTPGGGSASALAGAVGSSLLSMVASLPKPSATTEEDVERLAAAGALCADLAGQLERLVDRDAEAYDLVVAAYRLPKGTDDEKHVRSRAVQAALTAATDAPLDVMRACSNAIEQASVVARLGNRNAASDVHVGLELLGAGLRGGMRNVEINLGTVKDQDYVERVRAEVARLLVECERGIAGAAGALAGAG